MKCKDSAAAASALTCLGHVYTVHCRENLIYVFLEKELRGLSHNFHSHLSVSDLYIPTFGPSIYLQQNRQTVQKNIKIAHRNMNAGIGTVTVQFLSWEYLFRIFGIVSLQCMTKRMEETKVEVVVRESFPNFHFLLYVCFC
jgi:hypothetical protein